MIYPEMSTNMGTYPEMYTNIGIMLLCKFDSVHLDDCTIMPKMLEM